MAASSLALHKCAGSGITMRSMGAVDSWNMKLIYLQFVRLVRVYGTHMRADACLHVYVGM